MTVAAPAGGVIEDSAEPDAVIPDANATGVTSALPQSQDGVIRDVAVSVDIEHTYVGDLQVELVAPSGFPVLLHNRDGGGRNDIDRSYDVASTPALQALIGETIAGDWLLRVRDLARFDQGKLNAWTLKIWY
ncbi:MAG: hypothetical protein GY788_14735 [bacterium]|nr:hypothetical protein [bacterium]